MVSKEIIIGTIKSLFGSVPVVGAALNEVFFDIRSRIAQNRLNDFVEQISKNLQKIEHEKISITDLKSEYFSDFLELVLRKVISTRSKVKIKLFSDILTHRIIGQSSSEDEELLTSVIADLSEWEIKIITYLFSLLKPEELSSYSIKGEKRAEEMIDYSGNEVMGVPVNEFKIAFDSLISKGLVIDNSSSKLSHAEPRTFIKLTPLAIALTIFIQSVESRVSHVT